MGEGFALRRGIRVSALLAFVFLLLARAGQAAPTQLTNYTFSGGSFASTGTNALATASVFSIGPGLASSAATGNGAFNNPGLLTQSNATPSTEALSLSGSDYFQFTVTPQNGADLAFSSLFFNFLVQNNSNQITENVEIRWSVDNFASSLGIITQTFGSGQSTESGASLDLTAFQAQVQAVSFRMYFFDDQDQAQFQQIGITNVQLSATAVPEPSSLALLATAGLLALFWARRPLGPSPNRFY